MSQGAIAALMGRFFIEVLIISLPVLVIAVITGLIIAIFQTVTSIQEQTLSFVPKLIAIFLTLFFLGGWMLSRMIQFSIYTISQIGQ